VADPNRAAARPQNQASYPTSTARSRGGSLASDDVPATELASYCLHALHAASSLSSEAAVRRLVTVTLAG